MQRVHRLNTYIPSIFSLSNTLLNRISMTLLCLLILLLFQNLIDPHQMLLHMSSWKHSRHLQAAITLCELLGQALGHRLVVPDFKCSRINLIRNSLVRLPYHLWIFLLDDQFFNLLHLEHVADQREGGELVQVVQLPLQYRDRIITIEFGIDLPYPRQSVVGYVLG